ncbi:MAG: hypothetical protein U0P81_01415 [Holophagaceae bacterium]
MRSPLLAVPALALLVACARPEVEAFRQSPAPIAVAFEVPADVPGRVDISKEYAAAIRARLATRAVVIPEGVQGPANAATLRVTITEVREGRRSGDPSPVAVGVTTGVVVGALNAMAGNRNAGFEGFWWGLWAGTHAAAHQRHASDRLGWAPRRVNAVVDLLQPSSGASSPLASFDVDSQEVIDAMDPLSRADAEDDGRIREEEARAFSRVVVWKLQEQFGWSPKPRPSFWGERRNEAREEAPTPAEPVKEAPRN